MDRRLRHPGVRQPRRGHRHRLPAHDGASRRDRDPTGMAPESVTGAAAVAATVDAVFAAESARIVSAIVRVTGDWQLAEDSLQDAAIRALRVWPTDGVPRNPGAWLTTVAKNRAVDLLRRSAAERRAVLRIANEPAAEDSAPLSVVRR